jgi:hypothetical protein
MGVEKNPQGRRLSAELVPVPGIPGLFNLPTWMQSEPTPPSEEYQALVAAIQKRNKALQKWWNLPEIILAQIDYENALFNNKQRG